MDTSSVAQEDPPMGPMPVAPVAVSRASLTPDLPCLNTPDHLLGSAPPAPAPSAVAPKVDTVPIADPVPGCETSPELVPDTVVGLVEVPPTPTQAELKMLKPAAPANLIDLVDDNATAVAVTEAVVPSVSATDKVRQIVLALAREIRKPTAYVG